LSTRRREVHVGKCERKKQARRLLFSLEQLAVFPSKSQHTDLINKSFLIMM
jgi:hypothetical protein